MSRVLLIQSPYFFPDSTAHLSEPLGMEYLAANLRVSGHDVSVYDPTLGKPLQCSDNLYYYGTPDDDISRHISMFCPDVVGISCHYAYGSVDAYNVAQLTKFVSRDIITVMGGLFVSTHTSRPLSECENLDFCLVGEGDTSFPALLDVIFNQANETLADVDGLVWRDVTGIRHNEKTRYISDLDSLPFPARDLVEIEKYMHGSMVKRLYGLGFKPSLSLLTSRSCPNRCSFCNMRLVHGTRWRSRSAENVVSELDEMLNRYGAEHVFIMDDNFALNVDRAKEICEKIIQRGYRFRWNTPNGISVKGIDVELAKLMKQSGCANVCVAIESGSEYIRNDVMNKKTTNEQIVNAVNCLRVSGLPVVGFILLGMPGESESHFQATASMLKQLPLTSIVVSYAVPFPGTDLYDHLLKQGVLNIADIIRMDNLNATSFTTTDFTQDDLIRRKVILKNMFPSLAILYDLEMEEVRAKGL